MKQCSGIDMQSVQIRHKSINEFGACQSADLI